MPRPGLNAAVTGGGGLPGAAGFTGTGAVVVDLPGAGGGAAGFAGAGVAAAGATGAAGFGGAADEVGGAARTFHAKNKGVMAAKAKERRRPFVTAPSIAPIPGRNR
jgi:hypothetical protein